jgi:ATP-binding cassette subfamily B (MDR/TAP) protein 1
MSNLSPFGKARASAFKMFQVIHHEPSVKAYSEAKSMRDQTPKSPSEVVGKVELRGVGFSYPSRLDIPIFEDFSLVIPPGRSVAIVGSSGSGKSTIVSLIERFYDPTAGERQYDDGPILCCNPFFIITELKGED